MIKVVISNLTNKVNINNIYLFILNNISILQLQIQTYIH